MDNRISQQSRVSPISMNFPRWFEGICSSCYHPLCGGGGEWASIDMSVCCRPVKDYRICNIGFDLESMKIGYLELSPEHSMMMLHLVVQGGKHIHN